VQVPQWRERLAGAGAEKHYLFLVDSCGFLDVECLVDSCGFLVEIFVGLVVRFSLTYSYSCGCILVIPVMLVVRFVIVDLCDCDLCE
jgi:hypothetical protein